MEKAHDLQSPSPRPGSKVSLANLDKLPYKRDNSYSTSNAESDVC